MLIIICSVWRHKIYLKCMEYSKQSYKSKEQSMKKWYILSWHKILSWSDFFLENLFEYQLFSLMSRVENLKNNMNMVKNKTMRC